ncbi:AraC family transcriptional regulator [Bacillus pseudomycoides]|uniref:AraC family transcriptional regulator n=1 Tax=Bacillus pseudomycoides TaxID=64104 RepID=A0AA91VA40_9BACI|nr:AraC family transcriptional regulator [Bacillus sp. AFS098217]PED81246.1 AraC family transcriptional regulator [Bacillus pseudomycoides]PEU07068.1 AraC family transcriptional regulator [Bacillus sp. AFS019443]PEU15178.1 AraC family transcriptional regulator [Bacillus sp. AFS014408]PFW59574.1 AraC family transcriptional regulator [Bacillus sp. AFS075034]
MRGTEHRALYKESLSFNRKENNNLYRGGRGLRDFPNLKAYKYFPFQPEFEVQTDYYIEHKEKNIFNQTVLLFYQFRLKKDLLHSVSVIPDGCMDILFCCNEQKFFANMCGSVIRSRTICLHADSEYFGVRFLPNQEMIQSNYTIKEIVDKEVPLIDMFSIHGTAVEKLIYAKGFQERIRLFKELIGHVIFTSGVSENAIGQALNKIYASKGNVNMNQLAKDIGYSTRYIRKQFEEYIGISPKLFSKIVRYQSSLNMLIKMKNFTVWDVINENGYYDQAHLINEFKNFGSLTPNEFVEKFSGKLYSD